MSLDAPSSSVIDGAAFSVGIVAARYNPELVDALVAQVTAKLRAAGVTEKNIVTERVPGSHELPVAAQLLARAQPLDAIVALGVIIRGDTIHYELVAEAATQGLLRVALDENLPVIAGVVAVENRAQAEARCRGEIDRGAEFAWAALEMAALKKRLSR
jgi:6,7-dimethyl-8-ribityllumazine synthase